MKWESRITLIMAAGAIFYAGWIASAAHFKIGARIENENRLLYVQTHVVPELQTRLKRLGCDNDQLIGKMIMDIAGGHQLDWGDLDNGCKKIPKVKAPPPEAILKK